MILESKWHSWKLDRTISCKLPIGKINFEKMIAESVKKGKILVFKIMRTENKNRLRPDAEKRHKDEAEENEFEN